MKRVLLLFLLAAVTACTESSSPEESSLLTHPDWAEDVLTGVNGFILNNRDSDNVYAVFDFDNSCSIFDIEEQLLVHQIRTMSFAMDPQTFAETISTGLDGTPAGDLIHDISVAYSDLYVRYGPFTPDGLSEDAVQSDPMWLEFAAKTGVLYDNVASWTSTDFAYQWVLYLFTGMTEKEVYDLSYASCRKYSSLETTEETWQSPVSIESRTGQQTYTWKSGVSVTDNIRELFTALDRNGIDVWICSASGIQQVLAAVDASGLHSHCTGVLGMTLKLDSEGRYIPQYDTEATGFVTDRNTWWQPHTLATGTPTGGPGKVTAIQNAIMPIYNGTGPSLGLMDSTGDFNFCTEFSSMQVVVCMNRADRKITDGGGLIAETAIYERDYLGYTYENRGTDTFYLLQGRNENGMRSLRSSNSTVRLGDSSEKLFANEDNYRQLDEMVTNRMTVKQALDTYSSLFLESYPGYHSR